MSNFLIELQLETGMNPAKHFLRSVHGRFGSKMRLFLSGGAKLDEGVSENLFKYGFTILEGYGLTETAPALTFNPIGKTKFGSAGIPVPDVEIKVIDKNTEGVGEVVARGPNIMKGYYKKEKETLEVIKDGWLHTGDLGYVDDDGYLFLTGRKKEVIVLSSGLNVYPEEIEEAYLREAPVEEMCVFEAPMDKQKETMILWAEMVPDLEFFKKYGEVNLQAVIKERVDNVSRTLPAHKRLMGFTITLDKLPRTLLGKIKRCQVKENHMMRVKDGGGSEGTKEVSERDRVSDEKA